MVNRLDSPIFILVLGLLLPAGNLIAEVNQFVDAEIKGLLLDQTRTSLGGQFYRDFSAYWREEKIAEGYNISVRDQLNRTGTNDIVIYSDQEKLLQLSISKLRPITAREYQNLVKTLVKQLQSQRLDQLMGESPDLVRHGY